MPDDKSVSPPPVFEMDAEFEHWESTSPKYRPSMGTLGTSTAQAIARYAFEGGYRAALGVWTPVTVKLPPLGEMVRIMTIPNRYIYPVRRVECFEHGWEWLIYLNSDISELGYLLPEHVSHWQPAPPLEPA